MVMMTVRPAGRRSSVRFSRPAVKRSSRPAVRSARPPGLWLVLQPWKVDLLVDIPQLPGVQAVSDLNSDEVLILVVE